MSWSRLLAFAAVLGASGLARADWNPETRRQMAIQAMEKKARLDQAAAARAADVVERYREPLKDARRARRDAVHELRALVLGEHPNNARVKRVEERVTEATAKLRELESDRLRELGKVLSPAELGRLMLSWRAINQSIRHGKVAS